jgi:acyl-coenzyme A synthetase/AMP-(fatty) acid ligase
MVRNNVTRIVGTSLSGDNDRGYTVLSKCSSEPCRQPLVGRFDAEKIAVTFVRAGRQTLHLTRAQLRDKVERASRSLQALGLRPGGRVAVVTRNSVEAGIVALATTALGATYSSAAPEMGAEGLVDRFSQIEPCLLFAQVIAEPFDTGMDVLSRILALAAALPSLRELVLLDDPPQLPEFSFPGSGPINEPLAL